MSSIRTILCVVVLLHCHTCLADDSAVKKIDTSFPTAGLVPVGSGSGIIVGPRTVLTNRHVVQDNAGKIRAGFRIRLGPDYKSKVTLARVTWVCETYDLAILEIADAVQFSKIIVADDSPALGTKITAYGFPLGNEFGIG